MKIRQLLALSPFSLLLSLVIVITWCIVAFALDQPLIAAQKSAKLMSYGAANGESLGNEWWRIVTSQFLHVHLLHMLFNAGCIAIIGSSIERRHAWWRTALIYFVGGCVGQVASVVAYPELVSSGASQALMALCAAALVMNTERAPRLFALGIVAIQIALDIYAAHTIKAGHGFGFIAGLLVGAALTIVDRKTQNTGSKQ